MFFILLLTVMFFFSFLKKHSIENQIIHYSIKYKYKNKYIGEII